MTALNRQGQALIEAALTFGVLLVMFFCVYSLFLLSIEKIRALDTVHHLARAEQVGRSPSLRVAAWCFGRPGMTQIHRRAGSGIEMGEVLFRYVPLVSLRGTPLWQSVMRFPRADRHYLTHSWPGAQRDLPPRSLELLAEAESVRSRVLTHQDAIWDAADDIRSTQEAERG